MIGGSLNGLDMFKIFKSEVEIQYKNKNPKLERYLKPGIQLTELYLSKLKPDTNVNRQIFNIADIFNNLKDNESDFYGTESNYHDEEHMAQGDKDMYNCLMKF